MPRARGTSEAGSQVAVGELVTDSLHPPHLYFPTHFFPFKPIFSFMLSRLANSDDLAQISKLNLELFNIQHKFDPTANLDWTFSNDGQKYFKKRISGKNGFVEVAEDNSKLIGYIIGAIIKHPLWKIDARYAELESIFVEPKHQSAGLGAKLTADFINWCRENKVNYVSVIPAAQNESATKFYRKLGFSDYDLVMQLDLGK